MESSGSAREVFGAAARLGLTSFGGPIAHLGYFRREYVERRGWLDDTAFGDLVALCQSLPGPASSQLGFAIGVRRAGLAGGVAAWLGFTLPSAAILIAFGILSSRVDLTNAGWVHGLRLAAVAVVAQAVVLLFGRLAPDLRRRILVALAAAIALVWQAPIAQVVVIAGAAVVGIALRLPSMEPAGGSEPSRISRRAGTVAIALFAALLIGLPLLRGVSSDLMDFIDAFFRSGALVFGGGHVVLPLLHAAVVDPGWVTNDQFVAGYGAAPAVPGPLFTVAGYLGAVANVAPDGLVGGILAVVAIFLPGLLLIVAALPFWDRLRTWERARQALSGTNAAVVGLLAAALYTPVWTSAINGIADVGIALAGLGLLATGRVPPIVVVGLSALAGQLLAVVG